MPSLLLTVRCFAGTAGYFDVLYEIEHDGSVSTVPKSVRLRRADLRCLVRTAYSLVHKVCPPDGEGDIYNFWKQRFAEGTIWHDAMGLIDVWDGGDGGAAGKQSTAPDLYAQLEALLRKV